MDKTDLVEKPPLPISSPELEREVDGQLGDQLGNELLTTKECENCHQPLIGPFCGQCGQEASSSLKYFWVVILHLLDDIFSFDSRASRTLWPLLVRPAFLTNEYFSGRRVHYVPPLRLYLFISIVFFISLKFFVSTDNNVININDKQSMVTQVKKHIEKLKTEENVIKQQSPERIEDIANLNADIIKFTSYLTDLNSDYSLGNNKKIIKITRQLIDLEFEQIEENLPEDKKARFDTLVTTLKKARNGDSDIEGEQKITIDNGAESNISLDFLSDEKNKALNTFVEKLVEKGEKAFNSDTGPLIEQVISKLPQLMFILLPLFAVLLKVMFIFSKRLYMEHLTVALHSHSFIFISILLVQILDLLQKHLAVSSSGLAEFLDIVRSGLLLWIPIYLFLMQKKVYKQGYFLTLVKFSVIGTFYSILILITGLIAVVWGLMGT